MITMVKLNDIYIYIYRYYQQKAVDAVKVIALITRITLLEFVTNDLSGE